MLHLISDGDTIDQNPQLAKSWSRVDQPNPGFQNAFFIFRKTHLLRKYLYTPSLSAYNQSTSKSSVQVNLKSYGLDINYLIFT